MGTGATADCSGFDSPHPDHPVGAIYLDSYSLPGPVSGRRAWKRTSRLRLGDEKRVSQILLNLVGNGIKFTERGFVRVRAANNDENPQYLLLEITDTGIGIDPKILPSLFQAFHQADDSIARKYSGSGLGLVISRQLARLMEGDIDVDSQPNKGSVFRVRIKLPAIETPVEAPADDEAPKRNNPEGKGDYRPRTLIAEDNPVNQIVAEEMLFSLGCDSDVVTDGEQAVAACEKQSYDLILMDCHMPGMDGLEATRRIRRHEHEHGSAKRTPILAVTADVTAQQKCKCGEAGLDDMLSKPYNLAQMRELLSRWLKKGSRIA